MLGEDVYVALDRSLAAADAATARDYPGSVGRRQPVHTVYVPADQYQPELPARWGALAAESIEANGLDVAALVDLLDASAATAADVLPRVRGKLQTEPIEDLRIDFEDGYGAHSNADEDAAAIGAGRALAATSVARPTFAGIRFKSLEPASRHRGVRTVDLVLTGLLEAGPLPEDFVLTLPKVTHLDQVSAFVDVCAALESAHGLTPARCASRSRSRRRSRCWPPTVLRWWPEWCTLARGG